MSGLKVIRPVKGKTRRQLDQEWDQIAGLRAQHILSGRDISFSHVLAPSVLSLAEACDRTSVLDIGCGVGILTRELAAISKHVTGVDSSAKCIQIARDLNIRTLNAEFLHSSVERFTQEIDRPFFTLAVANMFLMTVPDLEAGLTAVRKLLAPHGRLVLTITHPCFWPLYWNYMSEEWFDYSKEIAIESAFRISLETYNGLVSTHFHRPLERYFHCLRATGFDLETIMELNPTKDVEARYPKRWEFPRFLAMQCLATISVEK
jgi:SAM-dependent methyltransferase